jgi:hypothetical protein
VTQRIDMAVSVAVHVHQEPIHCEMEPCVVSVIVGTAGHLVPAGLGVVSRRSALDGPREGNRSSGANLADRGEYLRGRDVVECAAPVRRSPNRIAREARVKGAELSC